MLTRTKKYCVPGAFWKRKWSVTVIRMQNRLSPAQEGYKTVLPFIHNIQPLQVHPVALIALLLPIRFILPQKLFVTDQGVIIIMPAAVAMTHVNGTGLAM